MTASQQMPRRFLRLKEVKQIVGLGHTSIYEKMRDGLFPKPHALGVRAVGWLSHDIDAWIESAIQKRSGAK